MWANAQTARGAALSIPSNADLGERVTGSTVARKSRPSQTSAAWKPLMAKGDGVTVLEPPLPLNSPLPAISGIERVIKSRHYSRSTVLFFEGHAARGVYVLCTGSAKVSICSADGKKLILRIARPGDVLGLYAGLTGRPFEATADAGTRPSKFCPSPGSGEVDRPAASVRPGPGSDLQ